MMVVFLGGSDDMMVVFLGGSDDMMVVFLGGWASQVSKEPQRFGDWQAAGNTTDCLIGSVPGVRDPYKISVDTRGPIFKRS